MYASILQINPLDNVVLALRELPVGFEVAPGVLTTHPVPFPTRPMDAYKGTVGAVLAVAGSRSYTGAAFLTSKAALRSGAGLVTLACPASAQVVLAVKTTCVITRPLPETKEGALSRDALGPLLALTQGKDALVVGPGLSPDEETVEMVREYLA